MPRPGSTRERKATANRRLLKKVKANGIDTDVGAVTTGEERQSGNFSLWHWLPASDLHSWPTSSVTSLSQFIFGGSLPTWRSVTTFLVGSQGSYSRKPSKLLRNSFFLSDRDSSDVSSAGGATHGGCERTSMPSPIRRYRDLSYATVCHDSSCT